MYIVISRFFKNNSYSDDLVEYNKFFFAYNLIHELGHALCENFYKEERYTVKGQLNEEMIVNKLSTLFWKENYKPLYNEIQKKQLSFMPEVKEKCIFNESYSPLEFFNEICAVDSFKRLIFLDSKCHSYYQNLFQAYSITEAAKSKNSFSKLLEENFDIVCEKSTDLIINSFEDESELIKNIMSFCKKTFLKIPITIVIASKPNLNFFCKENNLPKEYIYKKLSF